jgi:VanZ family protein
MKDVVSNRRVSILAWAAGLAILWAVFVVPSGQPWTGLVWLGALVFLLVSSVVLILGAATRPSLAPVIHNQITGRKS